MISDETSTSIFFLGKNERKRDETCYVKRIIEAQTEKKKKLAPLLREAAAIEFMWTQA